MAEGISEKELDWFLEEEGFNQYQRKAYSALLSLKQASAPEIASQSRVPEAKLYEVLRSLEQRGLVQTEPGRPKKFLVVDPKKGFGESLSRKKSILEKQKNLLDKVSELTEKPRQKQETVRLMTDRDSVLRFLTNYLREQTSEKMDACFPFQNPHIPMTNVIRQRVRDGIRIRLIGEVTPENYKLVQKYVKWGVEVRNCRKIAPPQLLRFSVFDNNAASFTIKGGTEDYLSIWTDAETMVKSIADLFMYYWSNGLKVD